MPDHRQTVALVTGGGRGIGRAISMRLAGDGAAIAVLDIDRPAAEETVDLIRAAGHKALAVVADITVPDAVEAAVAEAEAALGGVTALINNAGFTDAGDIAKLSLESWKREVSINLDGPYFCLRAMLPRMVARGGGGSIVNIASVNGVRFFGNPAYSAAKAGVINLTQAVASEYGRHGIRCNAVLPGSVRTDSEAWTIRQKKDPQVFKKLARWYPLGRVAEPDDVAKAVSFLASEDAGYITGVALPVDGGLLAGMNVMIDDFILESRD